MTIQVIKTTPFEDQKPGTSGLRKKTSRFMEPGYLENFVQSIFNAIGGLEGKSLVVGGDGRYFNKEAIQTIIKMAIAQKAANLFIGQNGILSTPAVSHLIRTRRTDGGLILSASHNPGGADGDFGLKFNVPNGGPAPENVTDAIVACGQTLDHYVIGECEETDLSQLGETTVGSTQITVLDPVDAYSKLMASLFDFTAIKGMFSSGFTMCFDAMHAVTGPYAKHILEGQLGAPAGTVMNGIPLEDFGGGHPDPNPVYAAKLMNVMYGPDAPDFGAASDGDGDRNLIVGRNCMVSPSDSLAFLVANAHLVPAYSKGVTGVARSMPTSRAVDRVAASLDISLYETPTGWKFFGNLLDAGKVTLCGEESAGTGSDHVREKDGLWAILLWLNILAVKQKPVSVLMAEHWSKFGRNYYTRHDYEEIDAQDASEMFNSLSRSVVQLIGVKFGEHKISAADNFKYVDPVDGSVSDNQGIRLFFEDGSSIIYRLSGTGTVGATLRVYLERCEMPDGNLTLGMDEAFGSLADISKQVMQIEKHTGRKKPDVVT